MPDFGFAVMHIGPGPVQQPHGLASTFDWDQLILCPMRYKDWQTGHWLILKMGTGPIRHKGRQPSQGLDPFRVQEGISIG